MRGNEGGEVGRAVVGELMGNKGRGSRLSWGIEGNEGIDRRGNEVRRSMRRDEK